MIKTNEKTTSGIDEYRVKLKRFSRDTAPELADFARLND